MVRFRIQEVPMLVGSILIPLIIGYLGSIVTLPQISTWYSTLSKPWWSPPNWLFGPIWTTLYVLMGIALFLVWREGIHRKDVRFAILIFGVQLVLSLIWSVVFFSLHALFGSFVIVMLLWLAILANIIAFLIISKWAGLLLVPYIIWVSIASYLNYSVYLLNH
ncbi:MAG: TspO/MBR family protein [Methanobacterium sp.]|uniref:TspO/MBR family protein n=1 Tax=Methanobacterium sp. TaxID=2164 RepID=UPI003C727D16